MVDSTDISSHTLVPFGDDYTDVIVRSTDNTDVKFSRFVLCIASPVLKARIREQEKGLEAGALPIVPMQVSSAALQALLRQLCPVFNVQDLPLAELQDVLECAKKYRIEAVTASLRKKLIAGFLNLDPIAVYAIACRCGLEPEAVAAAAALKKRFKQPQSLPDSEQWSRVSVIHYMQLLRFIRNGTKPGQWSELATPEPSCTDVREQQNRVTTSAAPFDGSVPWDVIIISSDNVKFHVGRFTLIVASEFFRSMFTLPQPAAFDKEDQPHSDAVPVSEDSFVLDRLLRICYPVPDPVITRVHDIADILKAAEKYEMDYVMTWAKAKLISLCATDPLQVYLAACQLHAKDLAATAAKAALKFSEIELEQMPMASTWKHTSTSRVRTLLSYHRQCCELSEWNTLTTDFIWVPSDYCAGLRCSHNCGGSHLVQGGAQIGLSESWRDYFARAKLVLQSRPGDIDTAALSFWPVVSNGNWLCHGYCGGQPGMSKELADLFAVKIRDAINNVPFDLVL
ncbi:hypothetical protein PUNSTDRAFT_134765 [Punctularia strigosozonata HHB-11173 SS5]|uniref:uncharacterized protein n=1 Tax=Punctularia strigosozonata (strain HHB-11173) TaxID=741275 RepID=UPI00044162D4|nr:uncharacterized protein PUNSTDRAFT_134765 [Punctularia strigosozonata HHB-11173 SS5]EIN08379.1 hypothetical protein PUNSTDRAFT_134765 [Punctularia strigosozonata HHB-11173 SS5]